MIYYESWKCPTWHEGFICWSVCVSLWKVAVVTWGSNDTGSNVSYLLLTVIYFFTVELCTISDGNNPVCETGAEAQTLERGHQPHWLRKQNQTRQNGRAKPPRAGLERWRRGEQPIWGLTLLYICLLCAPRRWRHGGHQCLGELRCGALFAWSNRR